MSLTLTIGNKNYSSWSMRPWIAMRVAGIPFREVVISLDDPDFSRQVGAISGTGKVPVLDDGGVHVWESLAILEHLAERFPEAGLWPSALDARAHARAISAEMHAGFLPLRRACPMNMARPVQHLELNEDAAANVRRIEAMWADCRLRFGRGGDFLFGRFGVADAMYAPIVSRFDTYGIGVSQATRDYMTAIMALPEWREWDNAALEETWVLAKDEIDWPSVPRR